MKPSFKTPASLSAAALACALLIGCMTDGASDDETQDGGNIVFAQEAKTMASAMGGSLGDTATNPVTLEKVVIALHYEDSCQCYVQSRQFTNTKKEFGRSRVDSIWLYSNAQAMSDSFLPRLADSIVHVRHVKRIDGHSGKDVDITARTTLVRKETDSGTVYVWRGTVTGVFKGRDIAGSTFYLTRRFSLSNGFGAPLGNMLVKRGAHDVTLVFNADGTTTCIVTRGNKHVRTTHIDGDDHES
jgi:hypothetical protein